MTALGPDVARRRFVLLTGLRWLRMGPIAAMLVVLLQDRGLTLAQVGVCFAVYGAVTALLELPTGGLADTFGARPVLVIATLLDIVGIVPLLVGAPVPVIVASMALLGAGRALCSGPLEAWYVGHARATDPAADIRTGLARGGVAEAVALGVGALVAGYGGRFLATPFHVEPLDIAVWATLVGNMVFLVAVWVLVLPRDRAALAAGSTRARRLVTEARGVPTVVRDAMTVMRRSPALIRLAVVVTLAAVPLVLTEVLWQPTVADLAGGATPRTDLLGLLAAGIFATAAVGSALAPWWGRRFGAAGGRGVTVAIVVQAGVVVAMAMATALPPFTAAFLGTYLLGGVWFPLHAELVHDRVTDQHRTTVLSTLSLGVQVGNVATQLTVVPLAAATTRATAWIVAAGVAVAGAVLVRGLRRGPDTDQPPELLDVPMGRPATIPAP